MTPWQMSQHPNGATSANGNITYDHRLIGLLLKHVGARNIECESMYGTIRFVIDAYSLLEVSNNMVFSSMEGKNGSYIHRMHIRPRRTTKRHPYVV